MENLIGLLLFVIVIAASAIGNVAERRKRREQQEANKAARSAGGASPGSAPGKTWQAPSDEVRGFLENLERRLSGEAPETPPQAPQPARSVPGAPPVLSPRTLRRPVPTAQPARVPAAPPRRAPAQVQRPARIQPRRPLRPGAPMPPVVAPAAEAAPITARVAPSEMLREASSAADAAFSAADYAFTPTESVLPDIARAIVEDRDSLRRAVIAREILGPPRSMTM